MFGQSFLQPQQAGYVRGLQGQVAGTTGGMQFDMNTMMGMMMPLMFMVVMVKMVGGALGGGEKMKEVPEAATA